MKNITLKSRWFILLIVLTAPLLYVIDIFIINMAISDIQKGVHASNAQVQLVIAAYLLGSASFLITGSRTGDYMGRKRVFFWGMFFFTLTSCLCGISQTATQLNVTRFLQGVSSSFMVPQSISFIQVLFTDQKERAKAIGWYGITLSIAAIIGQILGGYLVSTHFMISGWRLIFFINLPAGILSLWLIQKYLPETDRINNGGFDYSGAGILTAALACLIIPLTLGREAGWPLWSIVLIILAGILIVYFISDQKKKLKLHKYPIIDLELFNIREFNIGLLAVLFHFMLHTAYLLMIVVFLQKALHKSAMDCGLYFVLHAVLFMISSVVASKLIVKYGKLVLLFGLLIILIAFLLQIQLFSTHTSGLCITLLIGIYGLGNGFVLPSLLTAVLKNVPVKFAGTAAGTFSTFQQTASALGISILGGVFFYVIGINPNHPDYFSAFNYGLLANIVCLAVVAVMLYLLPKNVKDQQPANK